MKDVVIYTMAACGPCVRAKALLMRKGVAFREIDAGSDPGIAAEVARLSGSMTLPQIFADGMPLGGSDDLHALERDGRLDAALGLS